MWSAVFPLLSSTYNGSGFMSSLTIPTFCPLMAMYNAVWLFVAVLKPMFWFLSNRGFTTSKCPILAAVWSTLFPLFRAFLARFESVPKRKFTTSVCPCAITVCKENRIGDICRHHQAGEETEQLLQDLCRFTRKLFSTIIKAEHNRLMVLFTPNQSRSLLIQ